MNLHQNNSFEELTKITEQVRNEKKNNNLERIKKGLHDAVIHITTGAYEKMSESAFKGYDRTVLYSAEWTEEKDAIFDSKGNKKIFEGNVRLFDLIDKGQNEFKNELENFFNKDGEKKYHCIIKKRYNESGNQTCYIFISWGALDELQKINKKTNNNMRKKTEQKGFAPVRIIQNNTI